MNFQSWLALTLLLILELIKGEKVVMSVPVEKDRVLEYFGYFILPGADFVKS
jgi:hypothetical protein